jgi:hypothetical protein
MKRRGRYFKGQMAVVMTFAMATLLGAMALGTDVALMYFNWMQLQKGADAAALAGAFYLIPPNSKFPLNPVAAGCSNAQAVNQTAPDDVARAACTYAFNNNMAIDAADFKIYEPGLNLPAAAPTPNVQVWVNRPNLPYMFGKVIGLSTYTVSAKATALDEYVGTYSGPMFPLVFDCAGTCPGLGSVSSGLAETFGTKFLGALDVPGNWQFLDPGVPGGDALGNAIGGGLSMGDMSIGSDVTTKTGVTSGPVTAGWAQRMTQHNSLCTAGSLAGENCADPSTNCDNAKAGLVIPSNDPLLVTIPVADVSACTGSCTVPITGFAQVYLYSLAKSGSSYTISGCFVQQTDPNGGGGVAGAPNLGAIAPPTLIQ